MTTLARHGRKGWVLVVGDVVHEVPTSAEGLERWAEAIATAVIVGDVARITCPRREPTITTDTEESQ